MATIHGNHDTRQPYTSNGNDGNHDTLHEQRQPIPATTRYTLHATRATVYIRQLHTWQPRHATRYTSNRNRCRMCTYHDDLYDVVSCIHGNRNDTTRATATVYIRQLHTWQRRQPQPQPQPLPRGRTPRADRAFIPHCARKCPFTTRKKMTNPHHMTGIV
jgi:hypothetical protein